MGKFAKQFQNLGLLYITNTALHWIYVFHIPKYARIVMDSLGYCIEYQWLGLFAYVLMPNHIHLILKVNINPIIE